ncbi:MAG: MFS transporter [Chloroflexota bacterium]
MPPSSKWFILTAVGIGTFMTALDSSVVNVILPTIREALGSDFASTEWVVTIYLLVLSGLLLSFGRLGDLFGHRRVYLAGFGVFVASSALCGMAPSMSLLVAFRAIQALGAAMLASNSPAILTRNFPAEQRGQALGLSATMTYLGLVTGPAFGGWLAHAFGWQAVFYINLPIGLLALAFSLRFIPDDRHRADGERFDLAGAILFTLGLSALLLGLNQGHAWGWTSLPVIGLLLAALALLGGFVAVERRVAAPMLDLSLFRSSIFSLTVLSAILNYMCVYSIIFLMPQYLIDGRGLNTSTAGLLLAAQSLVMAVVAPISGTLSDRWGTRWPSVAGMAVLALGTWLLSRLDAGAGYPVIVFSLALVGLGTGAFISPNNSALMGAAPRHRQGIAAGVLATARSFGMVIGAGLSGAIFATVLAGSAGDGVFDAVRASFVVAAAFAGLGILTSLGRPYGLAQTSL